MTGAVVTVGTFDGVHLGHQAVLARAGDVARESGLERVAYAFRLPPREAGSGPESSCLLLPPPAKERLLLSWVDRVERADFAELRHLSAESFVRDVLVERLAARAVVVGEAFRFGRRREGDLELLRRVGEERGLRVFAVAPVVVDGEAVSSTRIRSLVARGEVGRARGLLGRPPLLVGEVVRGDGLGRTLGFPTANLALDPRVLVPGPGIYLAQAFVSAGRSPGLLYVGERPTVKGQGVRCEIHLFSPPEEDLYERTVEAHLLVKLRDDRAFPSLEALRLQMERDAALARSLLASSDEVPRRILP